MITRELERVKAGIHLSTEEMERVAHYFFDESSDLQVMEEMLRALYNKGEVAEEMASMARVMRSHAVEFPSEATYFDNCGTGGDGANTFNISTTSAFVLASLGVQVMKHGNRKISSESGSTDVLEALGIPFQMTVEQHIEMAEHANVSFLHAPNVHPRLKRIGEVRSRIEHATLFNLIGPFTNPSPVGAQLIGVGRPQLLMEYAKAMQLLGLQGLVITNDVGLDEAALTGQNKLVFVTEEAIVPYVFRATQFGLQEAPLEAIRGGDGTYNARITERILQNEQSPHRDTVVLNVGLGLLATGVVQSVEDGIDLAHEAIRSGRAYEALERARSFRVKEVAR